MKRAIITFTIALLIVASVVVCKNLYSCDIPVGNRGIRDAISAGDIDRLFIGSSTFRSNLDIDILDRTYDGRDYILAYGGNQLMTFPIQYDEITRRSSNSYDLMIFELDPLMLTEEAKLSDSRVVFDLSWDGKKELWSKLSSSDATDFSVFYEYFVTSGLDDIFTYPFTEPFYATRYNKGAKTGDTPSSGRDFLENEQFDISDARIDPIQEAAVLELIDKCRRRGQDFMFLESPHYHRLSDDPVYKKYLKYYTDLLDANNVKYSLASDLSFDDSDPEYFEDMGHMSGAGRRTYTEELVTLDLMKLR